MKRWVLRGLLVLTSSLLAILAAEGALRWRRSRSRTSTSSSFIPDSDLGYRLNSEKPGINRQGIRAPEIECPKPDNVFRVLVLGDSIGFAPNGFPDRMGVELKKQSPSLELINACVPGYTTYQERRLLDTQLLRYEPDLVILQYCLNDHHQFLHRISADGSRLLTAEAERALYGEGNDFWSQLARVSYLGLELQKLRFAARIKEEHPFPWEAREDFCTAWRDESWPVFEEHLKAMRDALQAIGARLVLVAVPLEMQLDPAILESNREYAMKPQRELQRRCVTLGVPLLDLFHTFEQSLEGSDLYTDGIHLTESGHALVTKELLQWLSSSWGERSSQSSAR